VIGGYLAEAQGEPKAVADAIRDHYKPIGQGDEIPTAPVTVAVSLADKLDTIFGFFSINEKPSGSKDPFALRRAGLGILALIQRNGIRIDLRDLFTEIASVFVARDATAKGTLPRSASNASVTERLGAENLQLSRMLAATIVIFLRDRLIQQERDLGVRSDLISAGFEGLGKVNDFVALLARVKALQSFVETEDGTDLLTAYKRAANILKKENWTGQVLTSSGSQGIPQTGEEDPLVLVDDPIVGDAVAEMASGHAGADLPQEQALVAALDVAEPKASAAIEAENFTAAMAALASLRRPIDAFFDHVTVNDPDPAKRERRLNLLMRFRDAVNRVADFSKIEG